MGHTTVSPGEHGARYATHRELMRFQGIPDGVELQGGRKARRVQIGNAVPLPLGRAVVHAVADAYLQRAVPLQAGGQAGVKPEPDSPPLTPAPAGVPSSAAGEAGVLSRAVGEAGVLSRAVGEAGGQVRGAEPPAQQVPEFGAMVEVPGNGSCLLYSVIASAPEVVREQLIAARLLAEDDRIADWLADPGQVRSDLEALAMRRSLGGRGWVLLDQAGQLLRQLTLDYLETNRDALPVAVQNVRTHFYGQIDRQITLRRERGLSVTRMIAELVRRGVSYVENAAYVEIWTLRDMYLRERVSDLGGTAAAEAQAAAEVPLAPDGTGLADAALSPQAMLEYLAGRDVRIPLTALDPGELHQYLLASYTERSGPLDDVEFDAVRDAVENWEQSWAADAGEVFLPLLASSLGIEVRVVQYRRRDPGTGQWEDAEPFALETATVGEGSTVVYLFYNGVSHFRGSAPPPAGKHASSGPRPVSPTAAH